MSDTTISRDPRTMGAAPRRSLYDKEVQGILWQVLVLGIVLALAYYLYSNLMHNLQVRGIKTGYEFLGREAGFDISESVISYSAASHYSSALLAGFLNTLHVAVIGCVLATILGVFIGVASMSRNWLMAKLTAGYIHFMRNIPVLLQLILWYSILISDRIFSAPRQSAPWNGIYFTQRGWYFPVPEWSPAWLAALIAIPASVIAWWLVAKWAARRQAATGQQFPVIWAGIALLIGLPFLAWAAFGATTAMNMPQLRGFNIAGGARISPEFLAVLVGLTLYTAAFIGEIVRSGIMAVPKGQIEAARALGLKESVILRKVTLPQALRVIIPPQTSQYLNVTKNSSLAVAVGYPDLVSTANTTINQTGQAVEGISIIMLVYLTTSLLTSLFMNWYNKRIQLVER